MTDPLTTNVISAVIGGIAGGLATLGVGLILYNRRRSDSQRNLRISLLAELRAMFQLELLSEDETYTIPLENVSTSIYKANSGRIGELTPIEARTVVQFYSLFEIIRPMNRRIIHGDITVEEANTIHRNLLSLKTERENAIKILRAHLSEKTLQDIGLDDIEIVGRESPEYDVVEHIKETYKE